MVAPYRLADDHIARLVQIVRDESGDHLTRPEFTETMLKLFEDIAGFETLPPARSGKYLKLLWLRYQIACGASSRTQARHK
jgi:hypothetical protein